MMLMDSMSYVRVEPQEARKIKKSKSFERLLEHVFYGEYQSCLF